MPWHLKTVGSQVLVVRDRDKKVVGRHRDRKKATAQLKVLFSLEKSQFQVLIEKASFGGDRSAAGRYAAEQRWKNHQKKESGSGKGRTTENKLQDGPTNLLYGRDDKGMPVMGTVAELTKRFGTTTDARSAYFRDKYNLKVKVKKQEEGTSKDFAESAQLGALQALEELCLSLNNVESLVAQVSVIPFEQTRGGGYPNGSFVTNTTGAVVNLSTSPCAWTAESIVGTVARIQGFKAERGQRPSLEEAMSRATIPSMFGAVEAALTDMKPFFGKSEPANQQDSTALIHRASQRLGYSVMVHEFGHAVDHKKKGSFTSSGLSADPSWLELESPSGYGRTDHYEKTAESFAAWWLFSSGSQGKASNAFTGTRDLGVKVLAPIFSQKEDVVKSEKISLVFAELPKDNPVFVFVLAGFFNDVDALKKQLLVDLIKASFGGDRSAAGRYAANMRWRGQGQTEKPREYQNISLVEYTKLLKASSLKEKEVESPVARKAYGVWGTSSFVQINETLRGHEIDEDSWIPESLSAEEAAQALKENFDEFAVELPKDATVFRGVAYASDVDAIEEGMIFTDKGLISTSTTFDYARSFGDGSELDLLFEIQIPKGTKVWVPRTAYVNEETEVTLPPNTRFKVKQVYEESDDYGDVRRVVMEVINE